MKPHESILAEKTAEIPRDQFAKTRWSLVRRAVSLNEPRAKAALSELCERYWYPLYAFLRRTGHQAEDAKDYVQGFLARLIERGDLGTADQEKGRLRSYLLASLKHFVSNERSRDRRQKRGGGRTILSLDQDWAEDCYRIEPVEPSDPESLYERKWALTLLAGVLEKLRSRFEEQGKGKDFQVLQQFLSWNSGEDYAEAGRQLGKTAQNVRVAVLRLRRRCRDFIRQEIADTVSEPSEVDEELRHFFAVLTGP